MPRPSRKKAASQDLAHGSDVPRSFKAVTPAFNHTRMESMVPMRDGIKLFTIIAIPARQPGQCR